MIEVISEITAELTGHYGTDLDICHAAWVSSGVEYGEEIEEKKVRGLIRSLMRQKHGSPFEDGYFRFRIVAPRGVRDEHVRHRVGSYSSASSRYKEYPQVYYIPPPHRPLKKIEGFKQMNPQYEPLTKDEYRDYLAMMRNMYHDITYWQSGMKSFEYTSATEAIRWGNPDGQVIPYIARFNPRSLMHFLALRTHDSNANHVSYPMWEIEQVARQIEAAFAEKLPITHAAFVEFGRESP